ncbi:tyrosine-protein phosphatase [Jiella endophytica]|nr:tyrosine-protein phosphatase [Jiella endophytica]
MTRLLPLGGVHNIRDLGGYAVASGGTTAFGRVFRGCGQHGLDAAGLEALAATGLGLVIDLRTEDELGRDPARLLGRTGIDYRHIPLFARLQPLAAMAAGRSFSMADRYVAAFETCGPAFASVFRAIAKSKAPLLVHCTAGKDRTGLVAALVLGAAGVSETDILADYALTETAGAALLKRLRESHDPTGRAAANQVYAAKVEMLSPALNLLRERWGGAEGYLADCGLAPGEIRRVADLLR